MSIVDPTGTVVNNKKPVCTPVILSEGRSPESKDLRTDFTANLPGVRRSFDSLRSLRMTNKENLVATAILLTPWQNYAIM